MGDFKHLLVVKFKEGVEVDEILDGVKKMVSEIDCVKSFEWGLDTQNNLMLTQGFTHAFLMTFSNLEDFNAYIKHPSHVEFSGVFRMAVEKKLVLDFPAVVVVKASA